MTFPRPKRDLKGARKHFGRLWNESVALEQQLRQTARPLINDLLDLTFGVTYMQRLLG